MVVASAREGVPEGERVTWGICTSCGKCLQCSLGLENKCKNLLKVGQTNKEIQKLIPKIGMQICSISKFIHQLSCTQQVQ